MELVAVPSVPLAPPAANSGGTGQFAQSGPAVGDRATWNRASPLSALPSSSVRFGSASQFSSGSPAGEQFTFVTHHPGVRFVRGALRARARSIAIANEVTRLIRIEQQGFSENDSSRSSKKSWHHRSRIRCHGEIRCWWNDARPPDGVRPEGRYTGLHAPQHSQDLTLDLPTLRIATLHSRR